MREGPYSEQILSLLLMSVLMEISSSCLPPFLPAPQNMYSTLCLASVFLLPLPLSRSASQYFCVHQKPSHVTARVCSSVTPCMNCPAQPPLSQSSVTWFEFLWWARYKNTPSLSIPEQLAWVPNSWLLLFGAPWVMLQHATAM